MALSGKDVALFGRAAAMDMDSDDDEFERRYYGGGEKTVNLLENCKVTMTTTSNTSSNNELLKGIRIGFILMTPHLEAATIICVNDPYDYIEPIKDDEAQADVFVQHWTKEYDDIMVETRGYKHAKDMLEESHSVLISGSAGDGKTTLAVHLTLSLVSEGYLPVVVYSPAEVQRCCNPCEKMVFLIDDSFGKSYLVREYLEDWVQRGHTISVLMSENIKFIFTSRNEILYGCFTRIRSIPVFANITDLRMPSISLNSRERKDILNNLVIKYRGSNEYPDSIVDTFCNEFHIIGFPATCRLLAIREHMDNAHEIINAPFTFLVNEIRQISNMYETRLQYAILVLVMLYRGQLPETLLSATHISKDDNTKVREVLESLGIGTVPFPVLADAIQANTSYVMCRDDHWVFIDHAINDAVSVVYSERHLHIFLQYADRGDLYRLLDVKDGASDSTAVTPTVLIGRDRYREVFGEMANDVIHGKHGVVFMSRCLQDPHYQREWLLYLEENHSFHNFVQTFDEYNRTPIYYMAMYDTKVLLDHSLAFLTQGKGKRLQIANNPAHTGFIDGFYGSIEGRNTKARDMTIEKWVNYHGTDEKAALTYFGADMVHPTPFEQRDDSTNSSMNPEGLAWPRPFSMNPMSDESSMSDYSRNSSMMPGGFEPPITLSFSTNAGSNLSSSTSFW